MKICLVGGIFGRDENLRAKQALTPETILLDGFRRAGVQVQAIGHAHFQPSDEFDVVHVHHLGRAALKMAASNSRARFVFTGHNGLIVTGYERSLLRKSAFHYVVRKADARLKSVSRRSRYQSAFWHTYAAGNATGNGLLWNGTESRCAASTRHSLM